MAMTDEERFRFDLTGFMVRPSILDADQIAAMRDQITAIALDPSSLPPEHRWVPSGPTEVLIDHPRIVDVLGEVIGSQVRIDSNVSMWRPKGSDHGEGLHQGGPMQADPIFGYRVQNGRIHAGMVRVIIELGDIGPDDGATQFLAGSHKSNFPVHEDHKPLEDGKRSPFLTGYSCPAGSAIFFTENLAHAGPVWRGDEPRLAVLLAYTNVSIAWSRIMSPPEVLAGLAPERRAYFREPWAVDFVGARAVNTIEHFVATDGKTMDASHLSRR